jgi:hypothetical protein
MLRQFTKAEQIGHTWSSSDRYSPLKAAFAVLSGPTAVSSKTRIIDSTVGVLMLSALFRFGAHRSRRHHQHSRGARPRLLAPQLYRGGPQARVAVPTAARTRTRPGVVVARRRPRRVL